MLAMVQTILISVAVIVTTLIIAAVTILGMCGFRLSNEVVDERSYGLGMSAGLEAKRRGRTQARFMDSKSKEITVAEKATYRVHAEALNPLRKVPLIDQFLCVHTRTGGEIAILSMCTSVRGRRCYLTARHVPTDANSEYSISAMQEVLHDRPWRNYGENCRATLNYDEEIGSVPIPEGFLMSVIGDRAVVMSESSFDTVYDEQLDQLEITNQLRAKDLLSGCLWNNVRGFFIMTHRVVSYGVSRAVFKRVNEY